MTTRPAVRTRAAARAAAGALGLALVLTACGSDAETPAASGTDTSESPSATSEETPADTASETPDETPAAEPSEDPGTVVDVSIEGGEVTPKGERVRAAVGEPITFRITSDQPGEMHVHSTPESEFDFPAGTTERTITVETPGLVEVELHDPDVTLVQLEVR
ncbi:hypothetical protein [Nocardioides perillae]|uniref:EfeO-type cupredoxin-like domain-containing protein n=1 Tax=Nocardioides perillae TaxID=1119534 RepID=A0A7Y9USW5_9ACTN|nr:hypothetical protein [Nocardioides perillae]NYG56669.1 hypothetical protein [Nocardioides perillae]